MEFQRQVSRMLHEEHLATLGLLNRLDDVLERHGPNSPPRHDDTSVLSVLRAVAANLRNETDRHFNFEETELFSRLTDMGEADIVAILSEEHNAIRSLAEEVGSMANDGIGEGFSADNWQRFRELSLEISERQMSHIQKETMALLPILDNVLEDEIDSELSTTYAMSQ